MINEETRLVMNDILSDDSKNRYFTQCAATALDESKGSSPYNERLAAVEILRNQLTDFYGEQYRMVESGIHHNLLGVIVYKAFRRVSFVEISRKIIDEIGEFNEDRSIRNIKSGEGQRLAVAR